MSPYIKYRLRRVQNQLGIRIRPGTARRRNLEQFMMHLRRLGFRAGTIIDVGVADGTFDIYTVYPEARYLLIEPMAEFEDALKFILDRYSGSYFHGAAAEYDGTATICYLPGSDQLHDASLSSDAQQGMCEQLRHREIQVRRIDTLVAEGNWPGPFLIKADTQGSELRVLQGCEKTLEQAAVVILEVSFHKLSQDQPTIIDVIDFMRDHGFVPFDIFGGHNRPYDNSLAQVDMAFVQHEGLFMRNHGYATPQQLASYEKRLVTRLRRLLNF